MLIGGSVVLAWVYLDHPFKDWYEMIPGFFSSVIAIYVVSLLTQKPNKEIDKEFDEMKAVLKEN